MAVKIGHASIDENGNARGGKAGDQNEKEVKISDYYVHKKGWIVLRCKDAAKREKIAEAAEKACKNSSIGYDQNQRNTLYNEVKDKGFDPSKTTKKVETDCSALVRVCIAYAYGKDVVGNIRTATEPAALLKTGLFEKLTDKSYCSSSDCLLRGDILCTPVSGHTAVVLSDGTKAKEEIEEECIVKLKVLRRGDKGKKVKALQNLLTGYGYGCGSHGVDGDFGKATAAALKTYQKEHGLVCDGIAGEKTWGALLGVDT